MKNETKSNYCSKADEEYHFGDNFVNLDNKKKKGEKRKKKTGFALITHSGFSAPFKFLKLETIDLGYQWKKCECFIFCQINGENKV